jgi:hypothetical protein
MENKTFKHLHIFQYSGRAKEKQIKKFENKYNICLPQTYKELINKYNEASLYENYFDFINKNSEEDMRCFGFFGFGKKYEVSEEITKENEHLQDPIYYGVPGLIGIASTAEGDTLCFDYRDNPTTCEPKVVLLVHDEYETDTDRTVHMKIEPIANSFDEFLDMLYEYKDEDEI